MRLEHIDGSECMPDTKRQYLVGLDRQEAELVRRVVMAYPFKREVLTRLERRVVTALRELAEEATC